MDPLVELMRRVVADKHQLFSGRLCEFLVDRDAAVGIVVINRIPAFVLSHYPIERLAAGKMQAIPKDEMRGTEKQDEARECGGQPLESGNTDQKKQTGDGGDV